MLMYQFKFTGKSNEGKNFGGRLSTNPNSFQIAMFSWPTLPFRENFLLPNSNRIFILVQDVEKIGQNPPNWPIWCKPTKQK